MSNPFPGFVCLLYRQLPMFMDFINDDASVQSHCSRKRDDRKHLYRGAQVIGHGGSIDVTSKVGVGTTFTVRIPV